MTMHSREELIQMADALRANPPAFFQIPGLHELDEMTDVEDHRIRIGAMENVHFFLVRPKGSRQSLPFVVNIHGGGMVRSHGERDILFAKRLALGAGCAVVSVDYHLAPRFPYPYPVDETEALVDWLLDNAGRYGLESRYILSGQSSGGNLAAAVTMRNVWQKKHIPDCLILAYSWLDLATNPFKKPDSCPDERREQYCFYRECYLDETDALLPEISPALAKTEALVGFPETLLIEGGKDELRSENLSFFRYLCDAGVKAHMHYLPESVHGFMVNQMAGWKEAQEIVQHTVRINFTQKNNRRLES